MIESHLALAERHIAESRDQISRQTLIVGDLEDTRRNSATAVVARKLLQSYKGSWNNILLTAIGFAGGLRKGKASRILIAAGATRRFDKECGRGGASALAPGSENEKSRKPGRFENCIGFASA